MYMAVALLVWVAWIINLKYEVRSRRYENTCDAYLAIMSRSGFAGAGFFLSSRRRQRLWRRTAGALLPSLKLWQPKSVGGLPVAFPIFC
jgi:hypothetical protein